MSDYLINNWLEFFAVVTSLIYIYFSINRKIWLWVLGIICSGLYSVVFFESRLYADMILNIYYIIISIYGYFKWIFDRNNYVKAEHEVNAACIHKKEIPGIAACAIILFIIAYCTIKYLPAFIGISSASLPFADSLLTSLSFVATWMLTRRYIEQWILWILINASYMVLYWYKGLYMTIFLSFVYTVMAVIGYIKWRINILKSQSEI